MKANHSVQIGEFHQSSMENPVGIRRAGMRACVEGNSQQWSVKQDCTLSHVHPYKVRVLLFSGAVYGCLPRCRKASRKQGHMDAELAARGGPPRDDGFARPRFWSRPGLKDCPISSRGTVADNSQLSAGIFREITIPLYRIPDRETNENKHPKT